MSERLKFKIMQGADEIYAERHEGDAWYVVGTKAGHVVQQYRISDASAEVDVFASMRVTLGAMRAGSL